MGNRRPRVIVVERMDPLGPELLKREADVIELYDRPGETLEQHLPDADGLVVRIAKITPERIALAPNLKVIGKHGIGVDNIDLAAATARGVHVVFTPGSNQEAVAEHTLMLMLMLARRVEEVVALSRAGQFNAGRDVPPGIDMLGKTLGLVGMGRIGGRLAEICRSAFSMTVLAFDPYADKARASQLGVELRGDLESVLRESDFVSIHAPLTPETHHIVGGPQLKLMKPGAFLVNCARGGLVDEQALADALKAGTIAGAGIDVWAEEPPPADHPLLHEPRCIVTPHVAGGSVEARRETARMVAEETLRVLRGEDPRYSYNPELIRAKAAR
jgi:D-3-phosphoglycerate dehydrogenase